MLIASLRDVIRQQSTEVEELQKKLKEAAAAHTKEVCCSLLNSPTMRISTKPTQLAAMKEQVDALKAQLKTSDDKRKDVEKEQEDLLVLLDEVTNKRKRDKERMVKVGLEVSEDEDDDDDDEDDEEDDEDE